MSVPTITVLFRPSVACLLPTSILTVLLHLELSSTKQSIVGVLSSPVSLAGLIQTFVNLRYTVYNLTIVQ